MIDFLSSEKGLMMLIIIGIVSVVAFIVVSFFEAIFSNEFDPVCEAKCKKCICYDVCLHHGRKYGCEDYMTEEMLRKKGMIR